MDCRASSPQSPVLERTVGALRSKGVNTVQDRRGEIELHLAAMRAFALVLARKRGLADHIVKRTVVAAWANIDACTPRSNMRVWLFRMIRNAYFAEQRPSERGAAGAFGALVDLFIVPPEPAGARAEASFRRAFDALPDLQREVLVLVGPEGFTLGEAAAVCGCTPAKIKSRANLARRRLTVILSQQKAGTAMIAPTEPTPAPLDARR